MRRRMAVIGLMVALLILCGCPPNAPVLSAVLPNTIPVGAPDTQLQLTGQNFVAPVSAIWTENAVSTALATTFVNSTELEAIVPAAELKTAGSATILAMQGTGQNQVATASFTITIGNVAPTLTAMTPQHVIVGAAQFTLTLTGTNFNSTSVVDWGSTALTTTLVSATQLTAVVPTADFATAGIDHVTVVNTGTGGGTTAALSFTVVAPLVITTTPGALPGGSIGSPYTATIQGAGGVAPYTWTVSAGTLPTGLVLNPSTGLSTTITGTPTSQSTFNFSITLTDSIGTLAIMKFKR